MRRNSESMKRQAKTSNGYSGMTLVRPEILLPSQCGQAFTSPERRLLVAVIQDVIDVLRKYSGARAAHGMALYRDAHEWLHSENRAEFSYLWVCDHLDIDPDAARRAVMSLTPKKAVRIGHEESFVNRVRAVIARLPVGEFTHPDIADVLRIQVGVSSSRRVSGALQYLARVGEIEAVSLRRYVRTEMKKVACG